MNSMKSNKILIVGLLPIIIGGWGTKLLAQQRTDSTIKTQNIDIYQKYKPEVSKASKTKVTPTLPGIDTIKPVFNYVVPDQALNYSYKSVPIRPLAMGIAGDGLPYDSYVALGVGNLNTILVDAGIAKLHSEKLTTTIHAKHLSQKKGGVDTRQHSITELHGNATYKLAEDLVFDGNIGFNRRGVTHYGGMGDTITTQGHIDSIKHIYSSFYANVGLVNKELSKGLSYAPTIGINFYGDNRSAMESKLDIKAPFSYYIDANLKLGIEINAALARFVNNDTAYANNTFAVSPYLNFKNEMIQFTAGFIPTWGKGGVFHVLPNLKFKTILGTNAVTLHGGWTGEIVRNTFEEMSTLNPFIHNHYYAVQTKAQRVFGGLDFSLGKHMVVGGTIAWNQWNHFSQFVNDYAYNSDGSSFKVINDKKVQAISLDAYFKYQIAANFALTGSGTWTNFSYKHDFDKVFHNPKVKLNAALVIEPVSKLHLTAGFHFWDGMYRLNIDQSINKMPAFADISLKANYAIIPRLSVFLQLNNLLNQQYARWNQYHVYGINVIGGLRFKF